ncbi:MAG: flagellar motor protein MotB [Verrucomicrobiae bacterium]|nr:flagellar motor protein MotB [Verrucomicrobiae bacterium]
MFDSGEATLKPEGEEILLRIASVLSQFPGRQVHVIGHADNVPIRASARHRYPSNWELSTARATAAVRFLCERGGVDPRRIGAVGYGEFRPVADNNTADGRAKNRRIEIVVLPDEMVWSAATQQSSSSRPPVPGVRGLEPPATKPVASTNAVGPLVSRPD